MKPTASYLDGALSLYLGDSLEVLPSLPAGSIGAVVTDPPYSSGGAFRGDRVMSTVAKYIQSGSPSADALQNFTGDNRDQRSFLAWCSLWMCAARQASEPGAVLCCFSDWRQLPIVTDAVQCAGWTWRNICTWWKPGCRMQKGRFSGSAEYLIYGTNGPHESNGAESPQNVISCATIQGSEKEHIAEKPQGVVDWAVSVSRVGAVVLDPFMGSGTTALSCIRTGRHFVGVEIDPASFGVVCRRIEDVLAQGVLPLASGSSGHHQADLFPGNE